MSSNKFNQNFFKKILTGFRFIPDRTYLKIMYRLRMKRKLDLDNPKTMNEKIQWLKLYNRKCEYTTMVDKYSAKKYVADIIGENHIIPTIGIWNYFEDIDFSKLPDQFVLKCTHDSGGVVICKDKTKLDIKNTRKKITQSLNSNFYWVFREWPYKNIEPRIIAEEYITDSPESEEFTDYKFYCFSGEVDCVLVCLDRNIGDAKFYFFDKEWNLKRYNQRGLNAPENFTIPKPKLMDEMFRIAEKLSQGHVMIRVDLYCTDKQVYFGELTFFPQSGFDSKRLPQSDLMFGDKINLDLVKEERLK